MYIPIPNPIPNWKSRRFPIPIPIPSQCGNFPSKRRRIRTIPTRTSLFAISDYGFISPRSTYAASFCTSLFFLFAPFFYCPIWKIFLNSKIFSKIYNLYNFKCIKKYFFKYGFWNIFSIQKYPLNYIIQNIFKKLYLKISHRLKIEF